MVLFLMFHFLKKRFTCNQDLFSECEVSKTLEEKKKAGHQLFRCLVLMEQGIHSFHGRSLKGKEGRVAQQRPAQNLVQLKFPFPALTIESSLTVFLPIVSLLQISSSTLHIPNYSSSMQVMS